MESVKGAKENIHVEKLMYIHIVIAIHLLNNVHTKIATGISSSTALERISNFTRNENNKKQNLL